MKIVQVPINTIIQGDTLTELKKLPAESVDMIITSPPYYALRNYGIDGQLGLEKTFEEYKVKILEITAELKRVLKKSGQLWWNMGDVYGTGSGAGSRNGTKQATNTGSNYYEDKGKQPPGEAKCLMMMPERIALEMIDKQGWILRNKIKWVKQVLLKKENITKGSVMPTSVKDRFNESGEELYFFVKNKMYYSDLDVVRLKTENNYEDFNRRVRDSQKGIGPQFKASEEEIKNYGTKMSKIGGQTIKGIERKRLEARMADTKNKDTKSSRTYNIKKLLSEVRLGIKPNTGMEKFGKDILDNAQPNQRSHFLVGKALHDYYKEKGMPENNPFGKNLPSVWLVGSEPHNFQKELDGIDTDHFATFPQALLEIPIKFGCPKGGIVLDPFGGAGTSAIVAKKLGRNYILIELNPKYIELAEKRLKLECPSTLNL